MNSGIYYCVYYILTSYNMHEDYWYMYSSNNDIQCREGFCIQIKVSSVMQYKLLCQVFVSKLTHYKIPFKAINPLRCIGIKEAFFAISVFWGMKCLEDLLKQLEITKFNINNVYYLEMQNQLYEFRILNYTDFYKVIEMIT